MILTYAGADLPQILNAAEPCMRAAQAWNADPWVLSSLRAGLANALRESGDVERASEMVDPWTEQPSHPGCFGEHCERADLEVTRGRLESALARYEALASIPPFMLHDRLEFTAHASAGDLWGGNPERALGRLLAGLHAVIETDVTTNVATMFVLAARASAELADERGSSRSEREVRLRRLRRLLAGLPQDPFALLPTFVDRSALAATWHAETRRLVGTSTTQSWAAAGGLWEQIARPHHAAYCWWRGADVATTSGQGLLARRSLRRAATHARGHQPLLSGIEASAGRAGPTRERALRV